MKTKKMISSIFGSVLIMALCFTANNSNAQTKTDNAKMKDCCMMKDGKMMQMKDGKMMSMDKDITLKNGTKCMANGECVKKNGEKIIMKNGQCMDMNGKITTCGVITENDKNKMQNKNEKK
jgi:hypothetical protein